MVVETLEAGGALIGLDGGALLVDSVGHEGQELEGGRRRRGRTALGLYIYVNISRYGKLPTGWNERTHANEREGLISGGHPDSRTLSKCPPFFKSAH